MATRQRTASSRPLKTSIRRYVLGIVVALALTALLGGQDAPSASGSGGPPNPLLAQRSESFQETQPQTAPDQIVVRFREGTSKSAVERLNAAHGARVVKTQPLSGLKRIKLPAGANLERVLASYRDNPLVEEAGRSYIAQIADAPNDPYYDPYQWHLHNTTGGMWAEGAWDLSANKGQGVVVAILDTGVAYEVYPPPPASPLFRQAPDLASTTFVNPWDFANNDAHANDDHGHGTHVTGTVAENTDNGYDMAGVAYNASIMPVKVLDYEGNGYDTDLVEAIHYAVDNGADVINMSLRFLGTGSPNGSGEYCTEIYGLGDALDYAYAQGVVVVAASGNEGDSTVACPAAYPTVIAVGATRFDGQVTSYSNTGSTLDITAPGGDLSVDQNGDGNGDGVLQESYRYAGIYTIFWPILMDGTSMATPHVAGTAALLLGEDGTMTPDEVRYALESSARDRGSPGWDAEYGWGVLDAHAALAAAVRVETGKLSLNQQWKTVSLTKRFSKPVVVARPPKINSVGPTVVRIRNVTKTSFQIRLQEWDYEDGNHVNEEVDYLVVEAGSYVLDNGDHVEAGRINTSATTSSATRSFRSTFLPSEPPAVITSVMTFNGSNTVTTRVHDITTSSFKVRMQEQEAQDNTHQAETIGYIAWEPGTGTVDDPMDYEAGFKDDVNDAFSSITFSNSYPTSPCFLADMNTRDGRDPANLRWKNKTTSGVEIQVDEEQSLDDETEHASEKVAYLAFACPIRLEMGKLSLDGQWTKVNLGRTFNNPVVVARPPKINSVGPTVVRIRNVTKNSFQIRLQEWDYEDGSHVNEEVDYLVVEAGSYVLDNGARVKAGKFNTNATTSSVTQPFNTTFPTAPAVITSVMTFNGHDTVTTRVHDVTTTSFKVRMQEQEAQDNTHNTETIGYIAWEPGDGTIGDPMDYEAGFKDGVTEAFSSIAFSNSYLTRPCFLADMNTRNGSDPANLRWKNKTTSGVQIQVDEEQSLDAETGHASEKVAYLAFACQT